MVYNWNTESYEFQTSGQPFAYCLNNSGKRSIYRIDRIMNGPAIVEPCDDNSLDLPISTLDLVGCVRCFSWPPVAMDWITRERIHAWPTAKQIHEVVTTGCDVVPVAHKKFKSGPITMETFVFKSRSDPGENLD